ncbi:hypothetical protein [Lentzea jiangxiensis]|uniref:Uncharacterized protein n=1 Tax=Lentzea jiangxiensis TaxID=641025 RepID=A0A1H0QCX4_9PSEU|nr:hypothetical protein [Lentzea jiangxiensis]SDP14905.1 hypothetical protein SAMN05421507_105410 [Lentzea jiangxiensis]
MCNWVPGRHGGLLAAVLEANPGTRGHLEDGARVLEDVLVHFGGRDRDPGDLAELAAAHGLVRESVGPVAGGRSVPEFRVIR